MKPPITVDPEIMSGKPVFAGTRVPVDTLMGYILDGNTLDDFLEDFPTVKREDAVSVLEYANQFLLHPARRVKILFDEGVPRQLRRLLQRDDISRVDEEGWKGIKNGRLLQLAVENNFDVLVTADRNLKYQQNLRGRRIAIIVLPYNRRKWMPLLVPALSTALNQIQPGVYVEIPLPSGLPE